MKEHQVSSVNSQRGQTISVIIPTYNSAEFIVDALASVLTQSYKPDELIICDDGSSDRTVDVVRNYLNTENPSFAWHLVTQVNKGPGAARNRAISAANCKWLAFLDSDDIWEPNKLEIIHSHMARNPNINMLCHSERIKPPGKKTYRIQHYGTTYNSTTCLQSQIYMKNMFSTSAVVISRSLVCKYGGFEESLLTAQDYELWLRVSPDLRPLFIRDVLGVYRQRWGNITTSSYRKRFVNEVRIAIRNRHLVSDIDFARRLIRISASYVKQVGGHLYAAACKSVR